MKFSGGEEGNELYDETNDPVEFVNLADDSRYQAVCTQLDAMLEAEPKRDQMPQETAALTVAGRYRSTSQAPTWRMKKMRAVTPFAFLFICLLRAGGFEFDSAPVAAAELRIGRAAIPITPTEETGGVKRVWDELYAKAIVLQKDDTTAAIVVLDLPVVNRRVVEAVRQLVEQRTAIPGGNVMISVTHTHTGLTPGWAGTSSFPALFPPKEGPQVEEADRYRAFLIQATTKAVVKAFEELHPARVSAAIGHEDSLPFNRRFLMKDGTVVFNPGIGNPDIVRPVGPIDPSVPVVFFESNDGQPLATMVNFAMHLDTVGGEVYSSDYPYTLGRCLADVKGPDMLTIFSIGTAGNINHFDVAGPKLQKGRVEAARIGIVLAAEVLRTYRKLKPIEAGKLGVARETVMLPPVDLQPGDLEKAKSLAAREEAGGPKLNLLERVFTQRVFFADRQQGRPLDVEVQVITLGHDLAWVALPGEVFVEIGLSIKRGSPFPITIIHELAYDWIRYVPDRKGFQEGSYEAINTRCGPGGGEALTDAAIRCLLKLHEAPQQPIGR